jgi:hypothetical protein
MNHEPTSTVRIYSKAEKSVTKHSFVSSSKAGVDTTKNQSTINSKASPPTSSHAKSKASTGTLSGTSSNRTPGLSPSTIKPRVELSGSKEQGFCPQCGLTAATLIRRNFNYEGHKVKDALVVQCDSCNKIIGWPGQSGGRIFAAEVKKKIETSILELRMPKEAVDLALLVHAALGIVPKGDPFALPIQLGLHVIGDAQKIAPTWDVLLEDSLRATERARPVLTEETRTRITGLQKHWDCTKSDVVRRLIAAAWSKFT